MNNRNYFVISGIPQIKGIDQLELYGDQRLIPAFQGWHQGLQRKVVVRLFPATAATDAIQQGILEALNHQLIRHRHPGIAEWLQFNVITLPGGRYYCLVNEWFADESLKDWLIRYGPMDEDNALLVAEHILTVLMHYWTNCQVAHGNLKPKNILVDKEGNLKVDEFGLTALLALVAPRGREVNIGTPAFMAPELRAGNVRPDHLSDIYALGMTLSCLLTGSQSAAGESGESADYAQVNMPVRVSMSLEMGEIIRHLIAARRKDRFPSWEAVRQAIEKHAQSRALHTDQSKKTQTIKIPIWGKDVTQQVGIGGGKDSYRARSAHTLPPPAAPAAGGQAPSLVGGQEKRPRVKSPVSVPAAQDEKAPPPTKAGSRAQKKEWIIASALVALLLVVLVLGYVLYQKQIFAKRPADRWAMPATRVLSGSRDNVWVKREELNAPVSSLDKAAETLPQGAAVQTNRAAAGEARAEEKAVVLALAPAPPTPEPAPIAKPLVQSVLNVTSVIGEVSGTNMARPETNGTGPASAGQVSPSKANVKEDDEQAPDDDPDVSAPHPVPVAVPATEPEYEKLVAWLQRAETNDAKAQCELGDYYASIDDEKSAFEWYQRAAEHDYPRALGRYGDCLLAGAGTRKNVQKAVEAYKKAAAKQDPDGQSKLAGCYLRGEGVPKSPKVAIQLYQSAMMNNHPESWCRLGDCALDGIGMHKNLNQALAYYRKAAELNNLEAKYKLVTHYFSKEKNTLQDGAELIRWLNAITSLAFDEACAGDKKILAGTYVIYGDCLQNGLFMPKDLPQAAVWYAQAAGTGNPDALYKYGLCLLNGTGVERNNTEAYRLFGLAADTNYAPAKWMLGECYLNGTGVKRDDAQAVVWFRKAAQQDVPEAQYRMGEVCLNGTGAEAGMEGALAWFLKSAEAGYEPAIEKVIECYEKGIGVKKNMQNSALWRAKLNKIKNK